MAGPQALARFWRISAKARGGAGINDLMIAQFSGMGDLCDVAHHMGAQLDGHVAISNDRSTCIHRIAIGDPFRQTSIQHGNCVMAHHAKEPPDPRSRKQAF